MKELCSRFLSFLFTFSKRKVSNIWNDGDYCSVLDSTIHRAPYPLKIENKSEIRVLSISHFPAGIYLPKVNNGNTRTMCKICSKLTIKLPFLCLTDFTHCFRVSVVDLDQVNAGQRRNFTISLEVKKKQRSVIRPLRLVYKKLKPVNRITFVWTLKTQKAVWGR